MIATRQDPVERYLKRLDNELRDLPRARRREIVDEIQEHITEARIGIESEAELLTLLDRIGDPADIAAEAKERFGVQTRRTAGWLVPAAILLILLGSVILPLLGWLLGVIFLWVSSAWTTRQKLVGTLVFPGGLLPAVFWLFYGLVPERCESGVFVVTPGGAGAPVHESCTGGPSSFSGIASLVVLAILAIGPFVTAIYLARTARQPAA